MQLKILALIASLFLFGCKTIEEPHGTECVVYSNTHMSCYPLNPDDGDDETDVLLSGCIGCFVYPAKTRGEIQKHHEELHERLDNK